MSVVDPRINDPHHDILRAGGDVPSLLRVDICPRDATLLPAIRQAPLLRGERVIGQGQRPHPIVRLGVKNVWVLAVTVQSSLQGSVGGKLDKVQSLGDLELPFDCPTRPGMCRHHGPSAGAGLEPDKDFVGNVLRSFPQIDALEAIGAAQTGRVSRRVECEKGCDEYEWDEK